MKFMLLTVHVELHLAYTCDFGKKHELEVFDGETEATGNCRTAFQVFSHVISSQKVFNIFVLSSPRTVFVFTTFTVYEQARKFSKFVVGGMMMGSFLLRAPFY